MIGVVERYGDRCVSQRFSGSRTCKDDILHASAAQLPDSLFTQNPPDRVGDIALSAAVRSDYAGDTGVELKISLICKGFKSLNFDALQIHSEYVSFMLIPGYRSGIYVLCYSCLSDRMAWYAACCSAAFLVGPFPGSNTREPRRTRTSKIFA